MPRLTRELLRGAVARELRDEDGAVRLRCETAGVVRELERLLCTRLDVRAGNLRSVVARVAELDRDRLGAVTEELPRLRLRTSPLDGPTRLGELLRVLERAVLAPRERTLLGVRSTRGEVGAELPNLRHRRSSDRELLDGRITSGDPPALRTGLLDLLERTPSMLGA